MDMGLFDRFKKGAAFGDADLEALQSKGDWPGLARAYFARGKDCLAKGDRDRAKLWLGRSQAISESDDAIYEAVGDKQIDQCSELLGQLEEETYSDGVARRVEEKYAALTGSQKRLWGLLTLCRLERVLAAAGSVPGCVPLRDTGRVIDALLDHYYGEAGEEAWELLEGYNDFISGWGDMPAYLDARSTFFVSGEEFQLLDFQGEILPVELGLYLDVVVSGELSPEETEGLDSPEVLNALDLNDQSGLVRCGLLTDHYLRTRQGSIGDIPQVRAEEERIWDDLEFLLQDPDEGAVRERVEEYRRLNILD